MPKIVLITGASRGVGAASAKLFAKNGFDVVLNCSSTKVDAEKIAEECKKNGIRTLVIERDISDEIIVKRLLKIQWISLGVLMF